VVRKIVQRIKLFSSNRKEFYLFLKDLIGFYPQNLKLYDLAFLHKSASTIDSCGNFVNNERLEFLGDAILSAIIADFLYNRFPQEDEGFLTKTRSKLVNRAFLTKLTYDMGLNVYIDSNTTKNIDNSHIYGDALEALIGAIYLDKGYNFTRQIIIEKIIKQHFDLQDLENNNTNYKSRIIEWSQREKRTVEFVILNEVGHGYNKQYVVDVLVDKISLGKGRDYSIKGAEQDAAMKALLQLETEKL